jgi:predicted nucleotidyltransferase
MNTNETAASVVSADEIIAYVDRIAAGFKPLRIVLFGSYACGVPTKDSDVDLLITKQRWSISPLTAAGRMRVALGVPFPMDLIVRSEADVRRSIAGGDNFLGEVLATGMTLYDAADERVGRQGRIRLRRRLRGAALVRASGTDALEDNYLPHIAGEADSSVTLEQVHAALAKIPGTLIEDFSRQRDDRF